MYHTLYKKCWNMNIIVLNKYIPQDIFVQVLLSLALFLGFFWLQSLLCKLQWLLYSCHAYTVSKVLPRCLWSVDQNKIKGDLGKINETTFCVKHVNTFTTNVNDPFLQAIMNHVQHLDEKKCQCWFVCCAEECFLTAKTFLFQRSPCSDLILK